jgi:excisionase family DNA binding protein
VAARSLLCGQTRAFAAKTDTNPWPPCGHGRVVAGCPVYRHYARIGHGVLAADRLRWAGGVWLRSSMDEPMSKERDSHSTRLLTTREAAAELGVHERTLRRYMSSGLLAYQRLPGGHYRIPEESIRNLWAGEDSPNLDRRRRPQRTDRPSAGVPSSGEPRVRRSRRHLDDEGADSYDLSPETLAALRARTVGDG